MATLTASYLPATGRAFVNLTSWAGEAAFTTAPVATDQIEYPDPLTVDAAGVVSGAPGDYTLRHVRKTGGTVEAALYQISVATTTAIYTLDNTHTIATLEAGFDPYVFQQWPVNEPAAGWQLVTVTAEGYFDSQGNYWFTEGAESVQTVWVIDLVGTVYVETVDNTGLILPLTGVMAFGTPTIGRNSASLPFTYSAADADGYEYRLDDGAWGNVVSPISLPTLQSAQTYTVDARAYNATTQSVWASITFTTSAAVDTTPDPFIFTAQTNVARSVKVTSNAITVQGVDAGVDVPISITGDLGSEYSVSTDGGATYGAWTATATTVRLNYKVRVRHDSSPDYSSGGYDGVRETALTIGGETRTFRSTTLADTTGPVITLTSGNVSVVQGAPWVEPGYSAIDAADGDISNSVVVTGTINTGTLGPQSLAYTATDASGNPSTATRTVTVVESVSSDTIKPVITLAGGNQTITAGDTWVEPGYSASDNVDGDLTFEVQVSGSVNTAIPDTYPLVYSVTDQAGNTGIATRTVTVLPAIDYPFTAAAPDRRTADVARLTHPGGFLKTFVLQTGEVLDYDFNLTGWLALEGGAIAAESIEITETSSGLSVLSSGVVTGQSRVKVWLRADAVSESEAVPLQLKVSTTGYRTAVFQILMILIDRMH